MKGTYFSVGETETLTAQSIDEAMELYVEDLYLLSDNPVVPKTVLVQAYRPMKISSFHFHRCIESLFEDLNEEYSSPDATTEPFPKVILEAWESFCTVVKDNYEGPCIPFGDAIEILTFDYVDLKIESNAK